MTFDFGQFAGAGDIEEVQSKSLPFLQLEGVPNLSTAQLKKLKPEFGWFLTKANAEACGFTPSKAWKETKLERDGIDDDGNSVTTEIEGYICLKPRFCEVLASDIEIQEKVPTKKYPKGLWTYRGPAFDSDYKPTQWRTEQQKQRSKDENRWCMVTRRMVLLLDDDNTPLNTVPLAFSCRSAWGANLGIEMREWRDMLSEKYIEGAAAQGIQIAKNSRLSASTLAYGIFEPTLSWRRTEDEYSPTVCVVGWSAPTHKKQMVGKTKTLVRSPKKKPYDLIVTGRSFEDSMVSKDSEAGKLIAAWQEEYADFVDPTIKDEGEAKTIVGRCNPLTVTPGPGNTMKAEFTANDGGKYIVVVPAHLAALIEVDGNVQFDGLEREGTLNVKEGKTLAVDAPEPVAAAPMPVAEPDYDDIPF